MPINFRSEFVKATVVLTSGTVLAQSLSYAFTPIITRLFSPEEVGELGLYMRIIGFISALATARYELALPLPKRGHHAFQLYHLALRITVLTTSLAFLAALVYWLVDDRSLYALIFGICVVLGTFFLAFRNIGTNWAIRDKLFRSISISKVSASVGTNVLGVVAGFGQLGAIGLVVASMFGHMLGSIGFIRHFWRKQGDAGYGSSTRKMRILATTHKDFPRINLPHVLIDTGREILLAYLIISFFDKAVFGSYDHSFRMLKLPLVLIGTGIGQVFFNQISELYRQGKAISPLLERMLLSLTFLSIVPFGIIYFYGSSIFVLVFGEQWGYSGEISQVLAPWLMVNFIVSPTSFLPIVIEKQKIFFWIGLLGTTVQVLGFWLLPRLVQTDALTTLEVFAYISYAMSIFLIAVTIYMVRLARKLDTQRISI